MQKEVAAPGTAHKAALTRLHQACVVRFSTASYTNTIMSSKLIRSQVFACALSLTEMSPFGDMNIRSWNLYPSHVSTNPHRALPLVVLSEVCA